MALRKTDGKAMERSRPGTSRDLAVEPGPGTARTGNGKEEQKNLPENPREGENRYRDLFDRFPIGAYRTTPDGRILLANPALVRMLGLRSLEELAGRNLECGAYEPDYKREWFKAEILKEGEIRGLEATWMTAGNVPLRVRENARAVRGVDGAVLYYEGTVEDITERKEAEEVLKARADFLEEVITNSSVGIFIIDEENRYVLINPECGRIVGRWPNDWTGKEAGMNVHPEDQGKAMAHFIQAISGEPNDLEIRVQASDGSYKHCRIHLSPMTLGDRAHVLGLVTDVTDRRSAEERLMQQRSFSLNKILVQAISALARDMSPEELGRRMRDFEGHFARQFEKLFEEDMHLMSSFEGPDGFGAEGPEAVLKRYLRFYSSLLRIMGIRTEVTHHNHEARFEILDCNWVEEAGLSPVPCHICKTILCDSFRWTGLNGTAEQVTTMTGGANSCRFDFRIGPHDEEAPKRQGGGPQ